jgi:DNA-binding GntR family transcriptional regulator
MARVDSNDPRAPYQQIADDLRSAIKAGDPAPNERLKSSRELAEVYGVAPMTVHQAMRVLRDEGLVESYQGRGVFVRSPDSKRDPGIPEQIEELRQRVDELSSRDDADISDEIADLRRQVGTLQAQLMDLYAKTGHPYPHGRTETASPAAGSSRHRKSS